MDGTGLPLAPTGAFALDAAVSFEPTPAAAGAEIPTLSLVICTLDEAGAIGGVLREATAVLAALSYEIIVVDDSADERTAEVVRAFASTDPRVRLIRRSHARGLASAVIAGWDAARGRNLAVCDGDGQHELNLLPGMVEILEAGGVDLVSASRYLEGETGLSGARDAMSRIGTRATSALLGAGLTDPLSGFFALRRTAFEAARPRLAGVGFKILVDVAWSMPERPRTRELPAALRERVGGVSKLDFRIMADLAALLVEKRTRGLLPARFVLFAGVGVSGVAVHMAVLRLALGEAPFQMAQAVAILAAMTSNFLFNNVLTFRDLRLRGPAFWRGLLTFYAACLGGGLISEVSAWLTFKTGAHWALAGALGAFLGGIWNYYAARRATWREAPTSEGGELAAALAPASEK